MRFYHVAYLLLEDSITPGECQDDWSACQESRARSAISRAYYAVFRALKHDLTAVRPSLKFPEQNVHRRVRIAIEDVLGHEHPLASHLRGLVRKRVDADYDLRTGILTVDDADDVMVAADLALDEVKHLTVPQLEQIAFSLSQSYP